MVMRVLPSDYDSDPDRFLSDSKFPHDDVHPYVAARLVEAGARRVLDVGGGNGRLARLLPAQAMNCLVIDLSPTMLRLAPRPVVLADGSLLPIADACVDAVAALYTLYHYTDPRVPVREARRVLRPGGLFVACAPNRDSNPELASVLPDWGASSTFDGEDAPMIVAAAFSCPEDQVEVIPWDAPLLTLSTKGHAVGFLRVHGLSDSDANIAARTVNLPLTLTMRGCFVYATKAGSPGESGRSYSDGSPRNSITASIKAGLPGVVR
jgi:SAM-dependent methyltransferase